MEIEIQEPEKSWLKAPTHLDHMIPGGGVSSNRRRFDGLSTSKLNAGWSGASLGVGVQGQKGRWEEVGVRGSGEMPWLLEARMSNVGVRDGKLGALKGTATVEFIIGSPSLIGTAARASLFLCSGTLIVSD